MQSPIVQAIALAIFGNDMLRGYERPEFWPKSSVFQFCKRVRFIALDGGPASPIESVFASEPAQWVAALRASGATAFRIHRFPSEKPDFAGQSIERSDRMSTGFVGGGGRWLIETRGDSAEADMWEAQWGIADKDDPEQNIWNVAYYRVIKGTVVSPARTMGFVRLKSELSDVLTEIESFASRHKIEMFAQCFRAGKVALSSDDPLANAYHSDVASTPVLSLEAKQLLGCALKAWVFGGMGSWNDLGFEAHDQEVYESLSDELFLLLSYAACSAVNSSVE